MISPENIYNEAFAEMMAENEEGARDFEYVHALVRASLFSRFFERREYAKRKLEEYWGTRIETDTLEDENFTYSLIRFNMIDPYIKVGKYRKDTPTFEDMPTEEDKKEWRRLL